MKETKSTLRIYIAGHCAGCGEAVRLADEVKRLFAEVDLQVIDLELEDSPDFANVFSVPTYVLDGRTISLGNPAPDDLFRHIAKVLA